MRIDGRAVEVRAIYAVTTGWQCGVALGNALIPGTVITASPNWIRPLWEARDF